MALETLKDVKEIGGVKIMVMDNLKKDRPELFNESGSMNYEVFERDIRPHYPIQIRHDKNSISFTLQNGPIKEVGVNGCQVADALKVLIHIYEGLQKKFPCAENQKTINKLKEGLFWQDERTKDREKRGVEGTSEK